MLACPRCGMRFTLGMPGAILPSEAAAPTGIFPGTMPGLPAPPPGYPLPPGYTTTTPGYSTAAAGYNSPGNPVDPTTQQTNATLMGMTRETAHADGEVGFQSPVRTSRLQAFLMMLVTAVAVTAAAIAVWYKLNQKENTTSETANKYKELNLEFEPPSSPWTRDEQMRIDLGSPYILVYKRDNPEAYMAFGAKDYDPRSPRESELQKGLMRALEKILDMPTFRPDPSEMEQTWMGQEAKGFKFHAQLKTGAAVDGQACRFAYKGIGYWFLSWTGENNIYDEMKHDFSEARRHCKLLDFRKDWKERESAIVPFKGDRVGYTILDAEGVWEEDKDEFNLKHEGEGADKILKMKRGKKQDAIQDEKLIVYVLLGAGDPMTVARGTVTGRRKEEIKGAGNYPIEFVDITEPPEGDTIASPIENPLPVLRFKSLVKGASSQNRFHVVSAAKIDDKIVVVHAYASLDKKISLESLFIQIASSLHGG
jgi:hypothetical protein